jgi:DNA-binding NarL/FixJ family response regulator
MLRVGIVDDHLLFRKSMTLLINSFEGINVEIEASNGRDFLEKLANNPVDVVLLDIQMPVMNGYETCKELQELYPNIKILVVSQLSNRESIHRIMELGAHGYFTKNSDPDHLETAIRSVLENEFYFGLDLGKVIRELLMWEKKNPIEVVNPKELLSDRELEIIQMISKQMKSKESGDQLCIDVRTVETHRKNIMTKTKAKNLVGIILFALKHDLINIYDL